MLLLYILFSSTPNLFSIPLFYSQLKIEEIWCSENFWNWLFWFFLKKFKNASINTSPPPPHACTHPHLSGRCYSVLESCRRDWEVKEALDLQRHLSSWAQQLLSATFCNPGGNSTPMEWNSTGLELERVRRVKVLRRPRCQGRTFKQAELHFIWENAPESPALETGQTENMESSLANGKWSSWWN